MSFLYSGSLWSSLYCGVSSLCVGLYRWFVEVSWLGKLVLVFWWVELDFFSLECNEVFTELYRGEKEEEGDINYLKLLLTQESVKWDNRIFSVNRY